jgi:hypothetical protein
MARAIRLVVVLLTSTMSCGGEIVESTLDGGDAAVSADADPCIPEGAAVNGHSHVFATAFEILACGFVGPDYISLNLSGYDAYWGGPQDSIVFSCKTATYNGCQVTYTDCSGWNGDGGAGCNITSTDLTFGPYGNGTVAHGMTSWSCNNQCGGSGSNITYLYPQP